MLFRSQRVYLASTTVSVLSGGFREDIETPFSSGTVGEGGIGDLTTILARGSTFQAALISYNSDSEAQLSLVRRRRMR